MNATDAVNVSQLTSATGGTTTAGMNFTGNDNSAGNVHRDLGQALAIQGGATTAGTYSGGNVRTVTDPATGAVNIEMADAPTFGGVTVNAGGTGKITGVTAGTVSAASTDAVNGSQLFATNQTVNTLGQGWTVSAQGANATNVGTASATGNSIDLKNSDGNIVVAKSTTSNDVSFDLANDIAVNSVTAGGTVLGTTGLTIAGGPSVTTAGISAGGLAVTNVAAGVNATDAVNVSQLTSATGGTTTAGMNFTGNDASAGAVHRDLGQTLAIQGGATTTGTYSGGNVRTVTDPATGAVNIEMADAPTFGGVTVNAGGTGKITGVTAGTATTDAVNVGQLQAVGAVADNAVQYDDAGHTSVTLGGTGAAAPVGLHNVAAGTVSATSTDAVNGSQLFATNQQVANNTTNIANTASEIVAVDNTVNDLAGDTSVTYTDTNGEGIRYARTNEAGLPQSDAFAQGVESTAIGYQATSTSTRGLALGAGAQASVDDGVALGAGSIANRALAPASGQVPAGTGFVPFNTSDQTLLGAVSVGAAGSYRQITNVADGTELQDAVTLRQLQGALQSVTSTGSLYFHANSTAGNLLAVGDQAIAVGPLTVVNGDNGIGIGNHAIVDSTAPGGTAIGENARVSQADAIALGTAAQANGIQSVAIGAGAVNNFSGSVALGAGSTTSVGSQTNYAAFALAAPQSSAGEVSIGSVGAERKLTNVAAGSAGTDGVNVSQLQAASQAGNNANDLAVKYTWNDLNGDGVVDPGEVNHNEVALAGTGGTEDHQPRRRRRLGNLERRGQRFATPRRQPEYRQSIRRGATVNADGSVTGPTYSVQGGNYSTVFDAFNAVDGSLTSLNNSINGGAGIKYFHANSTLADSQATGANSVAVGPASVATGANSTAIGNGAVASHAGDVALGSGSVTTAAVGTAGATIGGTNYSFAGANPTSTVSVGSAGDERTITNVAAGRLDAGSTDAVNGSQLNATNQQVSANTQAIGNVGASVAAGLGGASSYDSTTGTVTTALNVGGNNYNNVNDALQAINQTAGAGWNISGQWRPGHQRPIERHAERDGRVQYRRHAERQPAAGCGVGQPDLQRHGDSQWRPHGRPEYDGQHGRQRRSECRRRGGECDLDRRRKRLATLSGAAGGEQLACNMTVRATPR